jgi:hypothetical protein
VPYLGDSPGGRRIACDISSLARGQSGSKGDEIRLRESNQKGKICFGVTANTIVHKLGTDPSNSLISGHDQVLIAFIEVNHMI